MLYFDIGANIGKWTNDNIDNNRIIALEPVPKTFQILQSNVAVAAATDVVCLNYAVCDNNGEDITFYDALDTHTLSTLNPERITGHKSRFYNTQYNKIRYPTITIDTLIHRYGVPDLIKIDVEGGEYECVKSLTRKANVLCFEWASELDEVSFKCLDYLFSLGYLQFYLQFEDNYVFRPSESDYYDIESIKARLLQTTPKKEWGMIWCK